MICFCVKEALGTGSMNLLSFVREIYTSNYLTLQFDSKVNLFVSLRQWRSLAFSSSLSEKICIEKNLKFTKPL